MDFFNSQLLDGCQSLEKLILPDSERWYFTTVLDDAENKTNGISVVTDADGAISFNFITDMMAAAGDAQNFYLYKSEANND